MQLRSSPRSRATGALTPVSYERGRGFCLTLNPHPGEALIQMFSRLQRTLKDADAKPLKLIIYGDARAAPAAMEAMRRVLGNLLWPVTWVEGTVISSSSIAGIQTFALSGGDVTSITLGGRVVGSVFEDNAARCCFLGGLGPRVVSSPRVLQTEETLEELQEALAQADFSLGDVVRTWFFLEDLLSWYGDFNRVRTDIYSQTHFRSRSVPASTGVSGRNPSGAALTVGAWAMQPLDLAARAFEVASPLQCPAPNYGSSFSRAMEIAAGGLRRLLISGTASIEPDGRTAHRGDVEAQIGLSMQVTEAILESRGMNFMDVTRATAYFKSVADSPAFATWLDRHEMRRLPIVIAGCEICRDDLLFEIELDAERPD